MLRAMIAKELRETAGIALLALLAYAYVVACHVGWRMPMQLGYTTTVPFVSDPFVSYFTMVAAALCLALGLRQTVAESVRGTWLLLLQRPVDRRRIVAVKLATGLSLYLLCSALPILGYAWWAASPGKHAGPFAWEMTLPTWGTYVLMPALYLGAFLAGIRPGRWIGTRLLPAAAAGLLLGLIASMPTWWTYGNGLWWLSGLGAVLLLDACLTVVILFMAQVRDY